MPESNQFPDGARFHSCARQPRMDFLTAQHIEVGLAIQRCHGTYVAAKYMESKNIDIAVVRRALAQPLKRRMYPDWNYLNRQ